MSAALFFLPREISLCALGINPCLSYYPNCKKLRLPVPEAKDAHCRQHEDESREEGASEGDGDLQFMSKRCEEPSFFLSYSPLH